MGQAQMTIFLPFVPVPFGKIMVICAYPQKHLKKFLIPLAKN
jgi:hypothetical protein